MGSGMQTFDSAEPAFGAAVAAEPSTLPLAINAGGSLRAFYRVGVPHCPRQVATQAVALGAMIWGLKICLQYLDPYREQREQAKKRAAFLKRHLGRTLELNEFEQLLAAQVCLCVSGGMRVVLTHRLVPRACIMIVG
eukprot:XP_001693807.1 predicted protein [Chlamydomonas reinhardtii]